MIELALHILAELAWLGLWTGAAFALWPAMEMFPPLFIVLFAAFIGGISFIHAWLVPRILGHE